MAWSISDYNEFLDEARDLFGLEYDEAQELYRDMSDHFDSESLTRDDLRDYADVASDIIVIEEYEPVEEGEYEHYEPGDVVEEEEWEWEYDLDEFDPDDFWIDEGEEIEVTAEVAYEEGK